MTEYTLILFPLVIMFAIFTGIILLIIKIRSKRKHLQVWTDSPPYIEGDFLTTEDIIDEIPAGEDSAFDIDDIETQLNAHSRRLQKLYEIQATKGIDTEPHFLLEIEDIKTEIQRLQQLRNRILGK